jgi:hypothetical protein
MLRVETTKTRSNLRVSYFFSPHISRTQNQPMTPCTVQRAPITIPPAIIAAAPTSHPRPQLPNATPRNPNTNEKRHFNIRTQLFEIPCQKTLQLPTIPFTVDHATTSEASPRLPRSMAMLAINSDSLMTPRSRDEPIDHNQAIKPYFIELRPSHSSKNSWTIFRAFPTAYSIFEFTHGDQFAAVRLDFAKNPKSKNSKMLTEYSIRNCDSSSKIHHFPFAIQL